MAMALLRSALPGLLRADLAGLERQGQALSRVLWGHIVGEIVRARAAGAATGAVTCPACGRPMRRVDGARERPVRGLVGDDTLRRADDHCAPCRQGHAPLDARVGLGRGARSPELLRVVCRAGVQEAVAAAADPAQEAVGAAVSAARAGRATERMGAVVEAATQEAIARVRRSGARPRGATQDTGHRKNRKNRKNRKK